MPVAPRLLGCVIGFNVLLKPVFFFFFILGNWSRLSSSFSFTRRTGYFLIHIYAPCALIVILSWISFCIPHDSTAARIALGITSVLTITTILNMLNTTMPKVTSTLSFYLISKAILRFDGSGL